MEYSEKLQQVMKRIEDISHDEWASMTLKPSDLFFLIGMAQEYEKLVREIGYEIK
jgi:hypothetical protein